MAKGSYCHAKGSNLFTGEVGGSIRAADPYSTVRYKFNDAAQLPLTCIGPAKKKGMLRKGSENYPVIALLFQLL